MKKRVNKIVVVITAVVTIGALGALAKSHHDCHQNYCGQSIHGPHESNSCFVGDVEDLKSY